MIRILVTDGIERDAKEDLTKMEALDMGKVAGAALDVFEQEPTKNERLINHCKVSITPHIGASTAEAQERIGKEIVAAIKNYFIRSA